VEFTGEILKQSSEEGYLMNIRTIGIDLGKSIFHLVGLNEQGAVVVKKRLSRAQLLRFLVDMPAALVGMEACAGSHGIGRLLRDYGHDVKLIPAQFVRPFVKSNKNDYIDAEAIAEAVQRPTMRFVPIKTEDQLDLQALHRVRDRLVARRTGVINELRAFLLERGIAVRKGREYLLRNMPLVLEAAEQALSPRIMKILRFLWQEWQLLEARVAELRGEIDHLAKHEEPCRRLLSVPGVGTLVATAMVATVGNGSAFRKGRDFAAWLGLVPRQHSTGGKQKLLGISKRGDSYLRRLFIHGARSVVLHAKRDREGLGHWIRQLEARTHRNVLVVALANKLARIAWAVLTTGEPYRAGAVPVG
jgi:transposase